MCGLLSSLLCLVQSVSGYAECGAPAPMLSAPMSSEAHQLLYRSRASQEVVCCRPMSDAVPNLALSTFLTAEFLVDQRTGSQEPRSWVCLGSHPLNVLFWVVVSSLTEMHLVRGRGVTRTWQGWLKESRGYPLCRRQGKVLFVFPVAVWVELSGEFSSASLYCTHRAQCPPMTPQ